MALDHDGRLIELIAGTTEQYSGVANAYKHKIFGQRIVLPDGDAERTHDEMTEAVRFALIAVGMEPKGNAVQMMQVASWFFLGAVASTVAYMGDSDMVYAAEFAEYALEMCEDALERFYETA